MPETSPGSDRPTVFVSYSRKDEPWMNRLVEKLRDLEPQGDFQVWDDRKIHAGSKWLPEIQQAICRAVVAVLLISEDFLNSRVIQEEEVPRLRERMAEGLRVIPV